jgi:putative redox protein
MIAPLEVTVDSTDEKLGYTSVLRALPPIAMDYVPPFGSGQGYLPLELLLMSLGACSGGSLSLVLKKMGKSVTGVSVNAKGIRRETHPTSFQSISLEFIVRSPDTEDETMKKALPATEKICPVWHMVKNNAEIVTSYKLVSS